MPPRAFRQRSCATKTGLERWVDGSRRFSELHEVVGLSERSVMPAQKTLDRLLYRLLCVKHDIRGQRRLGCELERGGAKILCRPREPGTHLCDPLGVMQHEGADPLE